MVFGLCSGFSLGVNADDVQLYEAKTSDFTWYSSTIHTMNYANVSSVEDALDGSNTSYELPAILSSDYHAPLVKPQSYILDSYSPLSLSDIGYYSDLLLTAYSYNVSSDQRTYTTQNKITWKQRFKPQSGLTNVFINEMSSIYCNISLDGLSTSGKYINFDLTSPAYEQPVLKSGQQYLFSIYINGLPSGSSFNMQVNGVNPSGIYAAFESGFASFTYTPTEDVNLANIMPYIRVSGVTSVDLQVQDFTITAVYDDDDIVDAINNQTDDMNQNHQDTMDKIDDVTDFDDQEQSDLTGAVDGASDQINEKLGILSFGDHVLDQFIGIFDAAAGSPGITLPGFSIEVDGVQHVVWTDQVFDLSTIEDKFGPLMTAVHFATSFLVYAALVMYVQKIFGAIMQDWSDK